MIMQAEMTKGKKKGILRSEMLFPTKETGADFSRADLVVTGVDHSNMSYEVRVFLNNRDADDTTSRTPNEGYAGRFVVFGHGGCFGDLGHCDIPTGPRAAYDVRPPHPLTPQTKIVTITKALRRILQGNPSELQIITLVPCSKDPIRENRKLSADLFKFRSIELRTYR